MPPMTPLTPMTPITPHTPFGANCMTPLPSTTIVFRPNSPPKSITLQVPITQMSVAKNEVQNQVCLLLPIFFVLFC